MAYVSEHKEINNILVSGGDAFMNPNHILERYLRELSAVEHLDFIRFGSRVPVTLPERIYGDPELLVLYVYPVADQGRAPVCGLSAVEGRRVFPF